MKYTTFVPTVVSDKRMNSTVKRSNGRFSTGTQVVLASLGLLLSSLLFFLLLQWLFPLKDQISYSVVITDRKGEIVHAYLSEDQQWRMKATADEISPLLKKTLLAKEDKYFYYHPGANPLAIGRALMRNLLSGRRTSGASTISMQVARMLEPGSRTYFNKLKDLFRALELEWKYSKEEILQLYLNLVPYGGNIQGVKAAAYFYFQKNPDHLSLAEITALSIIPNRPNSLVIGRSNDKIMQERNRWLHYFEKTGLFTKKEISDALAEPLQARRHSAPRLIPHLSEKLRHYPGPEIHTGIDMNMQAKTEKLLSDYVRNLQYRRIHQAAAIVINNQTQQVEAYVGSANFNDNIYAGQVNGAKAIRQPGSTLKPLMYGLCLDAGLLTPATIITDVPVNYHGYAPENYDRQFNGYVSMEYALEHSLNIPAVKSLNQLGSDKLIDALAACQFEQIKKDRHKLGLSLILGGCGATLEELTGLFSLFAHEGRYKAPHYVITNDTTTNSGKLVLSPEAAYMINQTLCKVNRPDFPLHWQSTEHLPQIAWKTGTSYGRRDAWSIGYNQKYTVGIWVGNFSGEGIPDLSGANIATPLLFKIFNSIDYNSQMSWFRSPPGLGERMVCAETGLLPSSFCTQLITDYYIPLISSQALCNNRVEIMVSPDEKISYCRACAPASGYKKKRYRIVSRDMQQYFADRHLPIDQIPPHNPLCEKIFRDGAPLITSPQNGSSYLLSKKHPEPIMLRCETGNDVSRVYWFINDQFYKSSDNTSVQFFMPAEGPVKISCTDDKGRNRNIHISVQMVDY